VILLLLLGTHIKTGMSLLCYCQGSCPDGRPNGTCQAAEGAGCFASAEEVYDPEIDTLVAERTYGCLPSEEGGLMMCRGNLSPHAVPTAIECCKNGDFCNKRLYPMYDLSKYIDEDDSSDESVGFVIDPAIFHLVLLCSVTVCIVSLVFLVTCIYLKYKSKELDKQKYMYKKAQQADPGFGAAGTLHDLIEQTSGSGPVYHYLSRGRLPNRFKCPQELDKEDMGKYGWLGGEGKKLPSKFSTQLRKHPGFEKLRYIRLF